MKFASNRLETTFENTALSLNILFLFHFLNCVIFLVRHNDRIDASIILFSSANRAVNKSFQSWTPEKKYYKGYVWQFQYFLIYALRRV